MSVSPRHRARRRETLVDIPPACGPGDAHCRRWTRHRHDSQQALAIPRPAPTTASGRLLRVMPGAPWNKGIPTARATTIDPGSDQIPGRNRSAVDNLLTRTRATTVWFCLWTYEDVCRRPPGIAEACFRCRQNCRQIHPENMRDVGVSHEFPAPDPLRRTDSSILSGLLTRRWQPRGRQGRVMCRCRVRSPSCIRAGGVAMAMLGAPTMQRRRIIGLRRKAMTYPAGGDETVARRTRRSDASPWPRPFILWVPVHR